MAAGAIVFVALATLYSDGVAVFRPENLDAKLARRGEFAALRDEVARESGDVLADEAMGIVVLAGKDIVLQPFEFTQLARQGIWDETPVVSDIRATRFGMILINDGPETPESWTRERWTEAMLTAIHERYEPSGALAGTTIYRPRRAHE
jgi:hypothetical protein